MNTQNVVNKIKELRELTPKRNFNQSLDIVINLQQIDLKKPEHKVDVGITMTTPIKPKPLKICVIVDKTMKEAEGVFDHVLYGDDMVAMKGDMKKIRTITHKFDKFVVQSSFMPQFAQVFGRFLGPMNKMPSPKLGMVITDKTPLQPLYDKLQRTVHLQTRKNLVLQASIGAENESDEELAEKIVQIHQALVQTLVNRENNINNIGIKFTMSKLVVL
ncbi:MAG: hypothetical protein LAT82_01950 [Nanoarchaeota archaeon]|nr:hypothetical protein [Nanoarchaeota archaeon]